MKLTPFGERCQWKKITANQQKYFYFSDFTPFHSLQANFIFFYKFICFTKHIYISYKTIGFTKRIYIFLQNHRFYLENISFFIKSSILFNKFIIFCKMRLGEPQSRSRGNPPGRPAVGGFKILYKNPLGL